MLDYFDANDLIEVTKAKQRFQDEAATLTVLAHPGIPKIYDYFSEGDHNYIVMEYVEGLDLRDGLTHLDDQRRVVSGRPYPTEQVVRWGVRPARFWNTWRRSSPTLWCITTSSRPTWCWTRMLVRVRLVDFGTAKARSWWPRPAAVWACRRRVSTVRPDMPRLGTVPGPIFAQVRRVCPGGHALPPVDRR